MKLYFGTYQLGWKDIEVIKRLLTSGGFHPDIDAPPQPSNVNSVVEIPIKCKAQGRDHLGIAEETIIGDKNNPRARLITPFSELPSSRLSELGKFLLDRGWETIAIFAGSLASVYGTFYILAYHFKTFDMSLEWYNHLELIAVACLPAFADLCYAAAWRKKNEFVVEKNDKSLGNKSQSSTPLRKDPNSRCAI